MTNTPASTLAPEGTGITFANVVKSYGTNTVLHGINLDIQPGEFIALLGPSGCGKTTMLRCLAGLENVNGGEITVGGSDVSALPANKRDMGVVFQQYSLFPHMTVRSNVEFGLEMRKVPRAERAERVQASLDLVGLGHMGDRYAHTLSGGQQQRVALARALVTRPRALLLDEPLSALDAKVRVRLRDEIKQIQTELGITTIFVTHDQEEALAIADRVAVMKDGVIEQLGTPEELYQHPATPFVAIFIGDSNPLTGVLGTDSVEVLGTRLPTVDTRGLEPGSSVRVLVRPEHVTIHPRDVQPAADHNEAVVVSSAFLGSQRRTVVRLAGGEVLAVQHASHEQFTPDTAVRISFTGAPVAVEAVSTAQ